MREIAPSPIPELEDTAPGLRLGRSARADLLGRRHPRRPLCSRSSTRVRDAAMTPRWRRLLRRDGKIGEGRSSAPLPSVTRPPRSPGAASASRSRS